MIEALGDQCLGRSAGGSERLNTICKLAAFIGVSSKVLMPLLLGYEGKNASVSGYAEPVLGTLGWRKGQWLKPRSKIFMSKLCVCETIELTEGQLSTQTGNKIVGDKVSCEMSKLCTGQATKNCG